MKPSALKLTIGLLSGGLLAGCGEIQKPERFLFQKALMTLLRGF